MATILPPSLIGTDCRESFLPLPAGEDHPLRQAGVVMAGLSRLFPPYRISRPAQNLHLLMFTLRGRGRFRIHGRDGEFSAATAWLVGAGQDVRYEIDGPEWDIFWFHLSPDRPLGGPEPVCRLLPVFPALLPALMQGYIEESVAGKNGGVSRQYAEIIRATLDRLLAAEPSLRGSFPGDIPFPDFCTQTLPGAAGLRPELAAIWSEVERQPAKVWSVKRLANMACLSAPHLHRICRQQYGRTPMELVTGVRMRLAQRRLADPEEKLEALAAALGYSTAFAFSRAFKKHTGLSPSEFRRLR